MGLYWCARAALHSNFLERCTELKFRSKNLVAVGQHKLPTRGSAWISRLILWVSRQVLCRIVQAIFYVITATLQTIYLESYTIGKQSAFSFSQP